MTQTGEKTALFCLAQHDWKLDVALDNYFASPEVYFREPKAIVDKKKLDATYARYRGNCSGDLNTGLFGIQMVQTSLVVKWLGFRMVFKYWKLDHFETTILSTIAVYTLKALSWSVDCKTIDWLLGSRIYTTAEFTFGLGVYSAFPLRLTWCILGLGILSN